MVMGQISLQGTLASSVLMGESGKSADRVGSAKRQLELFNEPHVLTYQDHAYSTGTVRAAGRLR
ncbi:hypothetical protein HY497_00215 [Candidatus Woesearchaeota archaeon]|nr:hypothetical protein [Candidatus Woesearchaeota archaeon]